CAAATASTVSERFPPKSHGFPQIAIEKSPGPCHRDTPSIPLPSLPLSLAPLNVLAATLSILESVICVAETAGACLFCLRSLATAEVETAPASGRPSGPR